MPLAEHQLVEQRIGRFGQQHLHRLASSITGQKLLGGHGSLSCRLQTCNLQQPILTNDRQEHSVGPF